jgi:hypothetical protein
VRCRLAQTRGANRIESPPGELSYRHLVGKNQVLMTVFINISPMNC